MISADLSPRSRRRRPPRVVILAGTSLLGLFVAVHVILGPWAANWVLAALWLVTAGFFAYVAFALRHLDPATPALERPLHLHYWAVIALTLGFAGLAAATACRALGIASGAVLGLFYGMAAAGMLTSLLLQRRAGREAPTDARAVIPSERAQRTKRGISGGHDQRA